MSTPLTLLVERSVLVPKLAALIAIALISFAPLCAQTNATPPAPERKLVARVAPAYPELAQKMHIHGMVKIEATVRPNGSVRSTRVMGGSPILVDAAEDAVKKWKFETGQNETTQVVQVSFEQIQ
jgi:TonB family protein